MEFLSPPRRGFTVPMAATLASAASRAWTMGIRSGTDRPSRPSEVSGFLARARRRTSRMAAVSSSSCTFAAPVGGDFGVDAAARGEFADQCCGMRAGGLDYVFEHPVYDVLLEDSEVAVLERVHFEGLQLHAEFVGDVTQGQLAVVGETGAGTHGGELGHGDFDFVTGGVLIRPGLDLGQRGAHAGGGVFVGIGALHDLDSTVVSKVARSRARRS